VNFNAVDWLFDRAPIWLLGSGVLLLLLGASEVGWRRSPEAEPGKENRSQEGYLVSAVLGLLALLLGFTFSMAISHYDARRTLVAEEANAIGTAYLSAQALDEPHRSRISGLLAQYVDNRLALAGAVEPEQAQRLFAVTDALHVQMWSATLAAVRPTRDAVSASFMAAMGRIMDLAVTRRAVRSARVPRRVFLVLLVYMTVTAGLLGYVMAASLRFARRVFLVLLTISFLLILDIDEPTRGGVIEVQAPMEDLKAAIAAQPPARFERPSSALPP
jgi:hypothetical protein